MNRRDFLKAAAVAPAIGAVTGRAAAIAPTRTEVSIRGDGFLINGTPTYAGRYYDGMKIEGLLMNARVVQGIFDDLNPETRGRWVYPDTGKWDPERNTREFVAAMSDWRGYGLLAVTVNLQGGTPGAGGRGPQGPTLENSAIDPDGGLRPAYMARLARILDKADELGMVVIVGFYYFGQDQRMKDEAAVRRGVLNASNWLLATGHRNVLVEINNECNINYHHDILKPARVHELIQLVKNTRRGGRRFLVATSWGGPTSTRLPENGDTPATANVIEASDFVLIHGNGPDDPELKHRALIQRMIHDTRTLKTFRTMPVVINEADQYRFDEPTSTMSAALHEYVSWGYYDQGQNDYVNGFQSPPVNWSINTDRKKLFFNQVKRITGV